jgi:hypothetical protein
MLRAMRVELQAWVLACVLCTATNLPAQAQDAAPPAPATEAPAPDKSKPASDETKPATPADPAAPEPPPPPANVGDYAGSGSATSVSAATGVATAPEDDFAEADAPEYRKPVRHEFSVRFDPLNWLLLGRLRVELEASVWKFISVEFVPTFVTSQSPIALNYAGLDDPLTQHSNGIGPLSGASLGAGFWLSGEPFQGYVIRLNFTNHGYVYRSADSLGTIDRVTFTERRVMAFFGSHSRFGPFTFAGGFGLGYELHRVERCGLASVSSGATDSVEGRASACHGKQLIALDRSLDERADLNGPLHPVYFEARFSLGVVF